MNRESAIAECGHLLRARGYEFTTPTPLTHQRILTRRAGETARDTRDVFGWSLPFEPDVLDVDCLALLRDADLVDELGNGLLKSRIRFSSLGTMLFAHSAFPTSGADAVFFGPDTYRFARAVREAVHGRQVRSVMDVGAGSGAGGLFCAQLLPDLEFVLLADINPEALAFCAANTALNRVSTAQVHGGDVLDGVDRRADLVISNPPYLVDAAARTYRHGGGHWGGEVSLRIVEQGLDHLSETGRLVVYTGAPVVGGRDMFLDRVVPLLSRRTRGFVYEEIDPDVFGEELERTPYDQVERIAAVLLMVNATDVL
ncbi:MAG: class I SAM-dependent methyltransferase [Sphingomonadales bacterium]